MSKPTVQASPVPAGATREEGGYSLPAGLATAQSFHATIREDDPPDLADALEDLNRLEADAKEEGEPIPSEALMRAAEAQLRRLYGFAPFPYMVASAQEGEIIIYACPKMEHSISLTLYADGEVLNSAFVPGERIFVSFPTIEDLTDEALSKAGDLLKRELCQE